MEIVCANPACNNPFTPLRNQIYCSHACKMVMYRKRKKGMNGTDADIDDHEEVTEKKTSSLPMVAVPRINDPAAQYIINDLTRQRDKAESKVEKLEKEIVVYEKDIADLEKQLRDKDDVISKKPSALEGLLQPDNIKEMIGNLPAVLQAGAEMIRAAKEKSPAQISGVTEQTGQQPAQQQHPVIEWLGSQPREVQIAFIEMVKNFKSLDPRNLQEMIAYVNRSSMGYQSRNAR